jgi:hypothetical protein
MLMIRWPIDSETIVNGLRVFHVDHRHGMQEGKRERKEKRQRPRDTSLILLSLLHISLFHSGCYCPSSSRLLPSLHNLLTFLLKDALVAGRKKNQKQEEEENEKHENVLVLVVALFQSCLSYYGPEKKFHLSPRPFLDLQAPNLNNEFGNKVEEFLHDRDTYFATRGNTSTSQGEKEVGR